MLSPSGGLSHPDNTSRPDLMSIQEIHQEALLPKSVAVNQAHHVFMPQLIKQCHLAQNCVLRSLPEILDCHMPVPI